MRHETDGALAINNLHNKLCLMMDIAVHSIMKRRCLRACCLDDRMSGHYILNLWFINIFSVCAQLF